MRSPPATTDWLNTEEATAELGVVPSTVCRAINNGRLRAYRQGRVIRIRRADVEEFLERCRIKPGDLDHLVPGAGDR